MALLSWTGLVLHCKSYQRKGTDCMELLDSIKSAEQAAEQRKQDARREGERIFAEATAAAREEADAMLAEATRQAAFLRDRAAAEAAEEAVSMLKAAEEKDREIVAAAQKRLRSAAGYIISKL